MEKTYEQKLKGERATETKRNDAFKAKLRETFKLLGFTEKPRDWGEPWGHIWAYSFIKEDMEIYVEAFGYQTRDRVCFRVAYPKGAVSEASSHGLDRVEITCAVTKTAQQLANDITKRLMPEYLKNMREIRKRIKSSDSYELQCRKTLEKIKGSALTEEEIKSHKYRIYAAKTGYGHVQTSGGDASIELHGIPGDIAEKIMRLIA